jgi:hypothetical protein
MRTVLLGTWFVALAAVAFFVFALVTGKALDIATTTLVVVVAAVIVVSGADLIARRR